MTRRVWLLGAADPETTAIETLLRDCGEEVVYATQDGQRVHPGNAYTHGPLNLDFHAHCDGLTVIAVECSGEHYSPGEMGGALCDPEFRVDHHRPGDPGYGRPPEEYWEASSIGQVFRLLPRLDRSLDLGVEPGDEHYSGCSYLIERYSGDPYMWEDLHLVAAADHCLAAAYQGRCPGVDPGVLMQWRAESRANNATRQ